MPATLLKSITHRCFSKTLTLGTEELHFQTTYKIAFVAHLVLRNTNQGLSPKPNMKQQFIIL